MEGLHKTAVLLFLLILIVPGAAQNKDPYPYSFSEDYYQKAREDATGIAASMLAQNLSFTGRYREMLFCLDSMQRRRPQKWDPDDSIAFTQAYTSLDAYPYILEKAKNEQIIIFNEAHQNPRHRVFVTSMLKDLKAIGFNYLAAETFSRDTILEQHIQKISKLMGYYTLEPQFANMIRTANDLDFKYIAYEASSNANGREREIEQAENIAKFLRTHPKEKLIIYCGFAHAYEDSVSSWGLAMAGRLKQYTGIDPLTIDQTALMERSHPSLEHPYFRTTHPDNYAVLVDKNGAVLNRINGKRHTDIVLLTPATSYKYNRPGWIFENNKAPYKINPRKVNISYPLLAQVYLNEQEAYDFAVPVDLIEIRSREEMKKTALSVYKNRKFIIRLAGRSGQVQTIKP